MKNEYSPSHLFIFTHWSENDKTNNFKCINKHFWHKKKSLTKTLDLLSGLLVVCFLNDQMFCGEAPAASQTMYRELHCFLYCKSSISTQVLNRVLVRRGSTIIFQFQNMKSMENNTFDSSQIFGGLFLKYISWSCDFLQQNIWWFSDNVAIY